MMKRQAELDTVLNPPADRAPVRVPFGAEAVTDAVFLARPNRFLVEARLPNGNSVIAHCADRGRLLWLTPGIPLLLISRFGERRKTRFQVAAAWCNHAWASLDTHLPNALIYRALLRRSLSPFGGYHHVRREVRLGNSRYDFRLECNASETGASEGFQYLEVKSVGVSRNGVGLFPDAPTERGRRHLEELAALASSGNRAAVVFVAQHAPAKIVTPDRAIDPLFADALANAMAAGVAAYAYCCPIGRQGITLGPQIPVFERIGAIPSFGFGQDRQFTPSLVEAGR